MNDIDNNCILILGKQNSCMMLLKYMRAPLELTIGGWASQTWVGITVLCREGFIFLPCNN